MLERVEAIHVRVPFRRPYLDATGEFTHRRVWLLRVVDADGYEGLGEAALHPAATDAAATGLDTLMREIVPALAEERPPTEATLLAEGEPGRAALAALDGAVAALWAAREAGGSSPRTAVLIPVAAMIAYGGPDAGAEAAAQAIELGFDTLTLRAGNERESEHLVDRLRAVRAAVGPEPRLRIDAGGAWDLDTATERIERIEPYRIEFVEQPLAGWDVAGHAELRRRVGVPIALDESAESEAAVSEALAEGAADLLVVKPARVGGPAPTLRIAQRAAAAGVEVVLGTYSETGVGIAAALRAAAALRDAPDLGAAPRPPERAHSLATGGILVHDLLSEPLPIERGHMPVPGAVALDEAEVSRLSIERVLVERTG